MNQISKQIRIGTVGELLVQIHLLRFGVQAAPPLKDSGNDLIAVLRKSFRAIQVKTRTAGELNLGKLPKRFHLLALVQLDGHERSFNLRNSKVFLLDRAELERLQPTSFEMLGDYELTEKRVKELFKAEKRPTAKTKSIR